MSASQVFKSVYFPDSESRCLTLAFGDRTLDLYERIAELGSNEIRSLLGVQSYNELEQQANNEGLPIGTFCLWRLRKNLQKDNPHVKSVTQTESRKSKSLIGKIIKGDCLEVMNDIPSKSVDMILCDLPYGTTQNNWDSVIPLDRLWEQYERIVKDNGSIVLTSQGIFTAKLMLSNPRLFKYKIAWIKSKPTNFLNAKKQPLRKHEDICVFYRKQPNYFPQMIPGEPYNKGFRKNQLTGSYGDFRPVEVKSEGKRYPTDVIYFKTAESEGEIFHPTQKPIELGRYLIRTFTKKGDVVLDNACGSGSFLVSAALEGRNFIGIEKNEEVYLHKKHQMDYIDICNKRVAEAKRRYKNAK